MIVYKYSGDSGFRILEDLRLKVTPPNEFNDPFEITPISRRARPLAEMLVDIRKKSEYFRNVYDDMIRDGRYNGSFEKFLKELPSEIPKCYPAYKKLSRREMTDRDMKILDGISPKIGVLCFSKPTDNIPMWSYYADQHRGVVIGVDVSRIGGKLPCFRGFVRYRKNRVRYNPFSPLSREQRSQTIFTKSYEWQHEQEFRCIFRLNDLIPSLPPNNERKMYFLDIPSDSIREIILGCRITPELEAKIRQELARRKKTFEHVQVLKCVRHVSRYELKIVPAG